MYRYTLHKTNDSKTLKTKQKKNMLGIPLQMSFALYIFSVGTGGIYNLAHLNKTLNFNIEVLLGGFSYMKNKTTQNVC